MACVEWFLSNKFRLKMKRSRTPREEAPQKGREFSPAQSGGEKDARAPVKPSARATSSSKLDSARLLLDRGLSREAESGARIRGDRLRLEQALGNIVDNALRHGDGRVSLAATTANGNVELHVTDEGHGFPPQFVDHAFERFTRPHRGREGVGSGLGLSIVQAIAQAHGGEAHASNAPDGGADVWLALPVAAPSAQNRGGVLRTP